MATSTSVEPISFYRDNPISQTLQTYKVSYVYFISHSHTNLSRPLLIQLRCLYLS